MGREQLDLGSRGNQSFGAVEDFDQMGAIGADHTDAYGRPAMELVVIDLGRTHVELASDLSEEGSDDRALLLQGMNVAEQ